jgi:hypothetical protein
MESKALLEFKSHIFGKNADVAIFADRIEWSRDGRISATRLITGVGTGGISLLKTGLRKSGSSEVIPITAISSVSKVRDGLRFSAVRVITVGNTIDFRVSHNESEPIKELLTELILGTHPALLEDVTPTASPSLLGAAAPGGLAAEIAKLGELRSSGLLTEEQFETAKTKLIG